MLLRPNLNGQRLYIPGEPELWLMYHGMRHHVSNSDVHDALFSDIEGHTAVDDVEGILRGPDLNDGTCLARADTGGAIYLVTGFPAMEIRRHEIASYETFVAFGFDEALVREVPFLILSAVPPGLEIHAFTG